MDMPREERRPLRKLAKAGGHIVNSLALVLVLALLLYSAYSIWYTYSLKHGSFLSDELAMYKPDGYTPTLQDLMKENPDVVAWLTIDDTNIDYPVVQGEDNWEYLNKDVFGAFSLAGAIFLDSVNARDFSDPYNMIYGHHIEGGAMFADVLKFREASFFETHPRGVIWLADTAYHISFFACIEADGMDEVIYRDPGTISSEELPEIVRNITGRSAQVRDLRIDASDRIVGLSTCEDAEGFRRVLLYGKLTQMTQEEMNALMQKNREEAESSSDDGSSRKWYAAILRHPGIVLLIGGAILGLIVLFAVRKRRLER